MMPTGEVACVLIVEHVEGKPMDAWLDESTSPELILPISQEEYDTLLRDERKKMGEDLLRVASLTDAHTNIEKPIKDLEANPRWLRYLNDAKPTVSTLSFATTACLLTSFRYAHLTRLFRCFKADPYLL